ncbi:hypothetical protein AVEN_107074-1 [Araneus ventricosus]|uniref:Uncharacterized protein n=1 Tax=Araneus ventricosus TaxID=182803 RepID=A0A4Y2W6B7_ARAVE|nr:hypothetical protein AVEN_107074-1 [Araneus ventricosus]
MYRSFQNETNPLPKLWIGISDSESESVIPNPRNQSESNFDSRIRFCGFIANPIPRIRSFCSESDPFVPFEDPDPRIRSGVNDTSLVSERKEIDGELIWRLIRDSRLDSRDRKRLRSQISARGSALVREFLDSVESKPTLG